MRQVSACSLAREAPPQPHQRQPSRPFQLVSGVTLVCVSAQQRSEGAGPPPVQQQQQQQQQQQPSSMAEVAPPRSARQRPFEPCQRRTSRTYDPTAEEFNAKIRTGEREAQKERKGYWPKLSRIQRSVVTRGLTSSWGSD